MLKRNITVFLFFSVTLLVGCGESETPKETSAPVTEAMPAKVEASPEAIAEVVEAAPAVEEVTSEMSEETATTAMEEKAEAMVEQVKEEATAAVAEVTEQVEEAVSVATDKPYQLVDGVISANAMEGWKTYNGGGCGACHGKGGVGAVGPNLAESVSKKLSKEQFVNIVTNGVSGTMMRPHKTNIRVMDNMDNLYAYKWLTQNELAIFFAFNLINLSLFIDLS
jgi:hypothetical protein